MKRMKQVVLAVTSVWLLVGLAGCTVVKVPLASGGSRADAVVEFSYVEGLFEFVEVDWDALLPKAQDRCRIWGYPQAVPFESIDSECIDSDSASQKMTIKFQCLSEAEAAEWLR